ncbi:MAG: cytochrome c3 family protein [Myxococcaceae bacterium]|nr:cytochrome c3 family protein [Myxococcaceae bacterium]
MAAIFHHRANAVFRVVLVLLFGTPAVAVAGLMLLGRSPLGTQEQTPRSQPVQFDHRHHAGDEGIDCRYCHDGAERSAIAGVPASDKCMGCHAQVWNQSDKLALVRRSYFEDRPIRWVRVNQVPDFVFFDHSVHVHKGVGCVTCHGRVDRMPLVAKATPLNMGWCLDCHRDPAPHLRPREQIASMTWTPEGDPRALGEKLMREYGVRTRTTCTTCHR